IAALRTVTPGTARAARRGTAAIAVPPLPRAGRAQRRLLGLATGPSGGRVALVDPDLDADPAEGRPRLVEAVVDVRAQRVQRDPALAVELAARHLGAAEAAGALHPDALRAALDRALHGLAHGAPEGDPARQLLGDALRHELRVHLGVLHLE